MSTTMNFYSNDLKTQAILPSESIQALADLDLISHQENNVNPPKTHFYIEKLVFAALLNLFLLFLLQNIDCGYSLEPPHTHIMCTQNLCFEQN